MPAPTMTNLIGIECGTRNSEHFLSGIAKVSLVRMQRRLTCSLVSYIRICNKVFLDGRK